MTLVDKSVSFDFINAPTPSTGKILILKPQDTVFNYVEWIKSNLTEIEKNLLQFGGIIFRNFGINSISEFNRLVQIICPDLLDYIYRSTPRTKLGGKIYTATEYPKELSIPMHNENSYSKSWPKKIFFYSAIVAEEGGETPVSDSRNIYKKIDPEVRKKFEKYGVLYKRNYTSGIDLNWREVFQTNSKEEVDKYCKNHDILVEWKDHEPELTTKQICQATITHPVTGENIWFNQAHLFHASSLGNTELSFLTNELGEDNLPRNSFYGNGDRIQLDELEHIKDIYLSEKIIFKWQRGDVMLLDNMLMAHSREPFKGDRKVAVALG